MELKIIGYAHSPFKDKFGTPRQSQIAKQSVTRLVLNKRVAPEETLSGLKPDHYVWVLFWFHLNQQKKPITKVHPPRLRGEKMGVLATRSPHRPNPIGLSLGKVVEVKKNEIWVEGLDIVDKTPIIDIKPYLPEFDYPREKTFIWADEHPFPHLKVHFDDGIFSSFSKKEATLLEKQLHEILAEDPRPLAYLKKSQFEYWIRYDKYDIGFEISEGDLHVRHIKLFTQKGNRAASAGKSV